MAPSKMLCLALAAGAYAFAPSSVYRPSTELFNVEKGAGGMFDTRNPDALIHEDARKSISEAPSFEEYMKMRSGGGGAAPAAPAPAAPAPAAYSPPAPAAYSPPAPAPAPSSWGQPAAFGGGGSPPASYAPWGKKPSGGPAPWSPTGGAAAPAPWSPAGGAAPASAPAWGAPAAPAPAPAAYSPPAPAPAPTPSGGHAEMGAGGMFDTRNPDALVHEDARKSISEAPSFEEYMKSRSGF